MTLTSEMVLGFLGIFGLRILGVSISTVRMLILIQGRRSLSAFLGFFESLVFAMALGSVVTQLDNIPNLLAYCLGFAAGIYVGMWLEQKFIVNFVTVNVVSLKLAHHIAETVREAGYGATETWGQGAEGIVGAVRIVCQRKEVQQVLNHVTGVDEDAFITLDETRGIRHGYVHKHNRL